MNPDIAPIPVFLVTGFLGAGKTTLIRHLLAQPQFANSALLVNELGEIGIDQDIIDNAGGPTTVLLENGCICCALNDDLAFTLRDMLVARDRGEIRPFERVIVETTGIADPLPILRIMISDRWLAKHFALHSVLTLVDARAAVDTFDQQTEAIGQVAAADMIAISKTDLVDEEISLGLEQKLAAMNPYAAQVRIFDGALDPAVLTGVSHRSLAECGTSACHHDEPCEDARTLRHAVSSASLRFSERLPWAAIANALDQCVSRHRGSLLRSKGLIATREKERPVLIDGVQDAFHPPVLLELWPGGIVESRIVMIGRGDSARQALAEFAELLGLQAQIS